MCHPWLAAGAALLIVVTAVREFAPALRGERRDWRDLERGFLGSALHRWFRTRMEPLVDLLIAGGVSADAVTLLQLVMSSLCAVAFGMGWFFTAGWLLVGCGSLDVLDGAMARKRRADGPRGAFIDSVVDRYAESVVFLGLAGLYRADWRLWLVLASFLGAFMVSYTRARAEALGIDCRLGILQRPERHVLLGFGAIGSALLSHVTCRTVPEGTLLVVALWLVAVLANVTALQRVTFALRRLD